VTEETTAAAERLLREAKVLQMRGQFAAAEERCRQALEVAPDDVSGVEMLADLLVEIGTLEDARDLYQRALELQPGRSSAETSLARVVLELGEREHERVEAQLLLGGGSTGSRAERKRRVMLSIILSALFAGIGQMYNGEMGKGLGLAAVYLFSLIFGAPELLRMVLTLAAVRGPRHAPPLETWAVLVGFVGLFVWIYSVIDAAGGAQKGARPGE
jgi:tetratricopeptide (TPR) repeat protein